MSERTMRVPGGAHVAEPSPRAIQLVEHRTALWMLTSDGRIFERVRDPAGLNTNNQDRWLWREHKGPDFTAGG